MAPLTHGERAYLSRAPINKVQLELQQVAGQYGGWSTSHSAGRGTAKGG